MIGRNGNGWRKLERRSMIVSLDTGRSFDGILSAELGSLLLLRGARALIPGRDPVPVEGELVVDRSRVEFVQLTEARAP